MIVYFADRQLNILGQASTGLPKGLTVVYDRKTEDIDTGVAVFECTISFNEQTRKLVESCTECGNFILRRYANENEFFTIIDTEINTKKQEATIYAEDAGLDLLNEIVGPYEATKAETLAFYVSKFAYDSGFRIGINQAEGLTRKLSWDSESTVTERIASIATQFDGCEVSYSFEITGLQITDKFINIYKRRGKDIGAQLRLNKEIDGIITKKSVANLATGLYVTGGTPENSEVPISLDGYKYDDGDFFVQGPRLYSRKAGQKWSRYNWKNEPNQLEGASGYIVKPYSYDTTDQKTLFSHALTELKKVCDMEVNYEVDISKLPDDAKIGDRVNIIDDAGELYMSARILMLETSASDNERKATLGEYLIKSGGIHQKVADLAAQFAKNAQSAARALAIANSANALATAAQGQADSALTEAQAAQQAAEAAQNAANNALESASDAQEKATAAQGAVDKVEESVSSLETTATNAQQAADNAQQAATTAQQKADEAAQAAAQAKADAADAKSATEIAQGKAETAITKAEEATTTANSAKTEANTAKETADAAKLDAQKAQQDIDSLGEQLETVSTTMQTDYARKTDLTETEASLQSQISQNAAQISSTVTKVQEIDETANNAQEQAEAAQAEAEAAKAQADKATADAEAAQTAADNAAQAATAAQNEANTAKAAAATAQGVADKAEADLKAAQADLATVSSRVDATEEEIEAAQQAVTVAQQAADKAKADAQTAATKAAEAQTTADTAVTNAANAKKAADDAADKATIAQATADAAKGDAAAAQTAADEAKATANAAQATANTAKTNAANAQAKADQAATDAATAQRAADDADAKAAQAAADLATAQQNLENVTSRVDATEAEVEAAQAAVVTAQAAADKAQEEAEAAQSTADTAKANAATAQTAANNAKTAADNAQKAADDAQQAADEAQAAVDNLAVRVTTAETNITQNSEQIALMATKKEVAETLGGYYTSKETDAAIVAKADEINLSVKAVKEEAVLRPKIDNQYTNAVIAENALANSIDGLTLYGRTENKPVCQNLYNVNDKYNSFASDAGDWITVEIDNASGTSAVHEFPNVNPSALIVPDKNYLLVCEVKELTLEFIQVCSNYTGGMKSQFGSSDLIVYAGSLGTFVHPMTSRSDFTGCLTMLRTVVKCGEGQSGRAVFRISVIEDTTVTAESFVYQPFYAGLTPVEYIESTGTQYIDTGIVPTDHMVEVKYDSLEYDNDEHLFGTMAGASSFHFTLYSNKYVWGLDGTGENRGGVWSAGIKTLLFNYGDNHAIIQDGVTLGSGQTISSTQSIALCRRTKTNFKGRYYYFKVTDRTTGQLVRDMVPCRNAAGKYGLFDKVTNQFFGNNGTGDFIGGPVMGLVSVGDRWKIDVLVSGNEQEPNRLSVSTPNGLPGIPVDANGIYTDANGQQWICDEIDLGRGVYVQRVYKYTVTGQETITKSTMTNVDRYLITLPLKSSETTAGLKNAHLLSSYGTPAAVMSNHTAGFCGIDNNGTNARFAFNFATAGSSTVNSFKALIAGTEIMIPLATPIETDLTAEQIEAFKALGNPAGTVAVTSEACLSLELSGFASRNTVEALADRVTTAEADIAVKSDEIYSSVREVEQRLNESASSVDERLEKLTQEVSAKMTAEAVEVQIQSAIENGTSRVVTSTGYTFDDEGMTVQKSGSEMKTQISENGMTVFQNEEAVLTANNKGVDAKNLHATTYLIVGKNSRFEDFGESRTGCFWIGG